jgi:hypothetical protein
VPNSGTGRTTAQTFRTKAAKKSSLLPCMESARKVLIRCESEPVTAHFLATPPQLPGYHALPESARISPHSLYEKAGIKPVVYLGRPAFGLIQPLQAGISGWLIAIEIPFNQAVIEVINLHARVDDEPLRVDST